MLHEGAEGGLLGLSAGVGRGGAVGRESAHIGNAYR